MANRYISNLFTTRRALHAAFPPPVLTAIEQAIAASERRHGGELRFAIETALDVPALLRRTTARERAIAAFSSLRVWDTAANNGVLIYLLLAERNIEIVADRGFKDTVSPDEWQQVSTDMRLAFGRGEFEAGALQGIAAVCTLIARHFPHTPDDINELPDRPVLL